MKDYSINELTIGHNNPSFIPVNTAKQKADLGGNDSESEPKQNKTQYNDIKMDYLDVAEIDNPEMKKRECPLVYKISDSTPAHLTLFFALQQALLSLSGSLAVSLLVAQVVCAEYEEEFKARLLSSTFFMNGVTTLSMVLFGVRLPLYQGASADYVAPLLAFAAVGKDRCDTAMLVFNETSNTTHTINLDKEKLILGQVQLLQGSLLIAGCVHFLVGATGLVGILLRFIGPITIVPTILLVGIYFVKSVVKFVQVDWAVAILTFSIAIVLSLYLAKLNMPIPAWSTKNSCHVNRYPLHQVFAILIALLVGWLVSFILTESGHYDHATNNTIKEYYARTDVRNYVIDEASWFNFPHPGQFGPMRFSVSILIGYLVATISSILDSIGDYYACAATCFVPPPPSHAVNRGIAIEGLCTALSGAVGCGHATNTYGGNVGAIGLTKVASRHVFLCVGIIYLIFGIIGKVSAVFITIPNPVLGGILMVMFGAFNGVVLSNLQSVDLSSTRNVTIIGTGLLVGLVVPHWIENYPNSINTGNSEADDILNLLLGNPNLIGGILTCFLDNTIPGTLEERGIAAWQTVDTKPDSDRNAFVEGVEVYKPLLPDRVLRWRVMKYIPFMPDPEDKKVERSRNMSYDVGRRKSVVQMIPTLN